MQTAIRANPDGLLFREFCLLAGLLEHEAIGQRLLMRIHRLPDLLVTMPLLVRLERDPNSTADRWERDGFVRPARNPPPRDPRLAIFYQIARLTPTVAEAQEKEIEEAPQKAVEELRANQRLRVDGARQAAKARQELLAVGRDQAQGPQGDLDDGERIRYLWGSPDLGPLGPEKTSSALQCQCPCHARAPSRGTHGRARAPFAPAGLAPAAPALRPAATASCALQ